MHRSILNAMALWAVIAVCFLSAAGAKEIQLAQRKPDPYGWPRPWVGEIDVPLKTSFFIALGCKDKTDNDASL